MRRICYVILVVLCQLMVSCAIPRTTISQTADLAKYEYASVNYSENYQGSALMMDAEIKVYDAVENSRLKMVGEQAIGNLTADQKQQLLLVRYGVTQTPEETSVTVNFVDYLTGKPVASCRGAYGQGVDNHANFADAIKQVEKEIKKTFPKRK